MREKLARFMYGRYGNDRFNQFLMIVALVFIVLSMFRVPFVYLLGLAAMVYAYYRMLSKQHYKRAAENQWYLKREMKVRGFFTSKKKEFAQRKEFHIYKCPNCKQKIRVPKGKGKIAIRCRKCGTEFVKNS